jgi:hypothetical protein
VGLIGPTGPTGPARASVATVFVNEVPVTYTDENILWKGTGVNMGGDLDISTAGTNGEIIPQRSGVVNISVQLPAEGPTGSDGPVLGIYIDGSLTAELYPYEDKSGVSGGLIFQGSIFGFTTGNNIYVRVSGAPLTYNTTQCCVDNYFSVMLI